MNEFRKLVSQLNGEEDLKIRREIYTHVRETIIPNTRLADCCPPPAVSFYAIRNILYPNILFEQITDLLDLLANVDLFRQRALKQSADALVWNEFYKQQPNSGVRVLKPSQEERLLRYKEQSIKDRRRYMLLVFNLCQLDIYHLWPSSDPSLLPKRLKQYFPSSLSGGDESSSLMLHFDLSDTEKKDMLVVRNESIEWMKDISEWENARAMKLKEEGASMEDFCVNYRHDFGLDHDPPIDKEILVKNIEKYLKKVEQMIQHLEDYFSGLPAK
ncbi:hypothetical protein SERLA73DRAFT_73321 [Serpula lacrymans var. lacrymans S7.3]|uniref:Uncharacterized protein n=1 Tax=Serpula lacrymans var. lacrymans (strain S7.3) TaxID=936435 RepID=F8PXV7_SERL3|nr:hypothetical protein SERLA73DRAFT_73321 [Serpula lacrymans var. lacrymans S7.3]